MLQTIQNDAYVASLNEETVSVQVIDSSYDSVVAVEGGFNCCGTFGTFGSAGGCCGTFGTFGCAGSSDSIPQTA